MQIIPGETRLTDYLRYLADHCQPGEAVVKGDFHEYTPSALLQALPANLRKGVIEDCQSQCNVERLHVAVRSLFGRTEKTYSVRWSSDREGWVFVGGQIHYFVNRHRLDAHLESPEAGLISLCRRKFFENNEPFLSVDEATRELCEACASAVERAIPRGSRE